MASFDSINYSLRPSKCVQRGLVFEGLRCIINSLALENPIYVGLGSIWFTDFAQAHKVLDINDMFSIEADPIGFRRAAFNKTYRTIRVMEGRTGDRLPDILEIDAFGMRPWVIWLDYDSALDEEIVEDMRWVIINAPTNSVALFTFSASQNAYGKRPNQRPKRIQTLLGDVVPDELLKNRCTKDTLPATLINFTSDFLKSEAADAARPGGFIEAFRLMYDDSTTMLTVGGILPGTEAAPEAGALVSNPSWKCIVDEVIQAPQMTLREIAILQSELPAVSALTRARIQDLGFDLNEQQVRSFQKYYKYLPTFAEIAT